MEPHEERLKDEILQRGLSLPAHVKQPRPPWISRRQKRVGLAVVLLLLGCFGVYVFWPYDINSLQGDATISDAGFWSWPRYRVRFPEVSLSETGEHHFWCRGLPPYSLLVAIAVSEYDSESIFDERGRMKDKFWQLFEGPCRQSGTTVELTISEGTGAIVYQKQDALRRWILSGGLVLGARFYHLEQPNLSVWRSGSYRITLAVRKVDPKTPRMKGYVTLEGGGAMPH
jgi:hypothetical protein